MSDGRAVSHKLVRPRACGGNPVNNLCLTCSMLHHIITRSKTFYCCSQILFHVGFGFDFCNDSSQKLVIVHSAHMVEEYPFSLVLCPCAILKPGLDAIISGSERETGDDSLYSLTLLQGFGVFWI